MSVERNVDVLRQVLAALQRPRPRRDPRPLRRRLRASRPRGDPTPGAAASSGRTRCVAGWRRASKASRTSATTDDGHFVCGNRGVSEWTLSGTTVDGERIDVRGCDLWTFGDDGKIVRKDSFWKIREA